MMMTAATLSGVMHCWRTNYKLRSGITPTVGGLALVQLHGGQVQSTHQVQILHICQNGLICWCSASAGVFPSAREELLRTVASHATDRKGQNLQLLGVRRLSRRCYCPARLCKRFKLACAAATARAGTLHGHLCADFGPVGMAALAVVHLCFMPLA